MKIVSTVASLALVTQLYAGGNIVPVSEPVIEETHHEEAIHNESNFYLIAKALTISGDTVNHGHATLDGDRGYGFGIDIGYRLGHGFALEYDFSRATNTVTETDEHHHSDKGDATYTTHAIDLVYTHHLTHTVGLFVKGGYEYEKEEIDDFHIDSSDKGFAYGAGLEYKMTDQYTFVVEYEGSTIEGPRGDAIFAGVMYNF